MFNLFLIFICLKDLSCKRKGFAAVTFFFLQTEEHLSATAACSDVGDSCTCSTLAFTDQGLVCVCKYSI